MGIKIPTNKIYKEQNTKLIPSSFKKAIISDINVQIRTADVYIIGNIQTIIKNIPLAKSIDVTTLKQGDRCKIDVFDESNPNDCVIAYTY